MDENDCFCPSNRLVLQLSMILLYCYPFKVMIGYRKMDWTTLINSENCFIFLMGHLVVYGTCCYLRQLFVLLGPSINLTLRQKCVKDLFLGYGLATLVCSIGYCVRFDPGDMKFGLWVISYNSCSLVPLKVFVASNSICYLNASFRYTINVLLYLSLFLGVVIFFSISLHSPVYTVCNDVLTNFSYVFSLIYHIPNFLDFVLGLCGYVTLRRDDIQPPAQKIEIRDVKTEVKLELEQSDDEDDYFSFRDLECIVCYRNYEDDSKERTPKILSKCGHTVCRGCAEKLIRNFNLVCPMCSKWTYLGGSSTDMLPTNFAVLGMIQQVKNSKAKFEKSRNEIALVKDHPLEVNEETSVLAKTNPIEKKTKRQKKNRKRNQK
uniref:RING-type domain-containing protein n=1 Tax=Caenorhabditis tropicalis TaxID=1561998 RepID=A0A1I7UBR1_9PELO